MIIEIFIDLSYVQIITYYDLKFSANLCLSINKEIAQRLNFYNKHYKKLKFLFLIFIYGNVELNPGPQLEQVFDNECNIFNSDSGLK